MLGPGTGFGQAQLFWNEKVEDYTVMPSEVWLFRENTSFTDKKTAFDN